MIPARFEAVCELCNGRYGPVDTRAEGTHQWTSGWVMQREGGGGHGVSLPERENRWAHRQCVDEASAGNLGQTDMLAPRPESAQMSRPDAAHEFKDTNRHLIEVPDSYAIARWPRDADVQTICRCIFGTLKYEPHAQDLSALRRALETIVNAK